MRLDSGTISVKLLILGLIALILGLAILFGYSAAIAQARNQHRLADISAISKGLAVYYQENGVYPPADTNGMPENMTDYLEFWPQPPSPDGVCTAAENKYDYQQQLLGEQYSLSFCLGSGVDSIAAGPHLLGPTGIQ